MKVLIEIEYKASQNSIVRILNEGIRSGMNCTIIRLSKHREGKNFEYHTAPSLDYITKIVASERCEKEEDLKIDRRFRNIVLPRQICMWLARKHTKKSMSEIGRYYGRDHATVMHSCKAISNLIDTDKEFKRQMQCISKQFII